MSMHRNSNIGLIGSNHQLNSFPIHQRVFSDPSLAKSIALASNQIQSCQSVPVSPFKMKPMSNENGTPLPPNIRPSLLISKSKIILSSSTVVNINDLAMVFCVLCLKLRTQIELEMSPDLTQAYFQPAENKKLTRF